MSIVLNLIALGTPPWTTADPFLFCVHHHDAYPRGNEHLGPAASLRGRNIGQDFEGIDGWRMYHGDVVPGFPRHPHRGFETITLVRHGYTDHSDSLGATARFGQGDVQWMTAGEGIVHAEMFPLVERDRPNPLELFQIWLNLPAADKLVPPYFSMFWKDTIPEHTFVDSNGGTTQVAVIAGNLGELTAPKPPPNSWAARAEADVAIWTVKMSAGARWELPPARQGTSRTLYFFRGSELSIGDQSLSAYVAAQVRADVVAQLTNGPDESELLVLQGRPIGDPVAQYGPFVMNTRSEIQQAFQDYQRTGFGGWPWASDGPVHPREERRFAIHADGREERPDR